MLVVFRGNFQPDLPAELQPAWSTETHLSASLELLGHEVVRLQEDRVDWVTTVKACVDADLFVWVATRDYSLRWNQDHARQAVAELNDMLPTVGVHLDLWHGLNREAHLREDVYWTMRYYFTADGDHDQEWRDLNIRHFFSAPAVYGPECVPGNFRPDWASDIAFIGSWQSYVHNEHWPERRRALAYTRERFGNAFQCWPREGHGAVRSKNLNDLLASVKVILGDSCLASQSRLYHSDRVWEVVGRGGFCVHPWIEGLAELLPEGYGVAYFPPGDLDTMGDLIDHWRNDDAGRAEAVARGQAYVRENHTYAHRLAAVLETLRDEGVFA